jgi:hypothetical protein
VALRYILALVTLSSSFGDIFRALGLEERLSNLLHYLPLADRREREHLLAPSRLVLSCLADVELLGGIKDSKVLLSSGGGLNGVVFRFASPAKLEDLALLRRHALTYFSMFLVASGYLFRLASPDDTVTDISTEIQHARYWLIKEWPSFPITSYHGS